MPLADRRATFVWAVASPGTPSAAQQLAHVRAQVGKTLRQWSKLPPTRDIRLPHSENDLGTEIREPPTNHFTT